MTASGCWTCARARCNGSSTSSSWWGAGGRVAYALDPGNPHRAPGAFGEKSVLLLPGYTPPAWLDAPAVAGRYDELAVRGRGLGDSVAIRVWSPAEAARDRPLRLLLAHDGPEYDALASLTRFTAAKLASGELPPHRVALLAPGDRDQWYSASKVYGRVLAHDVIPALREAFPTVGALVGMGASLGGLAMLHVQRSFPRAFGALFLQSGSFFLPRYDPQERRFVRFNRIVRFVRATQRDGALALPIPVTLTVGAAEENAANNRAMAHALAEQGYEVELEEVPDMHNYTGWRDALRPAPDAPAPAGLDAMSAHELYSPAIGAAGTVVTYGHYGRPVLAFPAERGRAWDWQDQGMVAAVGGLLEAGRVKLYCVDSFDSASWSDQSLPVEERARQHGRYESWILDQVVPFIHGDTGGEILTTGISLGAFHAVNFALKRADLFPLAIGMSGNYDPAAWNGWGERGEQTYFNNPVDYVEHLHGEHLDWLRGRLSVLLVCGQGMWEDSTGALESSKRLAGLLGAKGIPHELDLWGHDVAHDWPSWRAQIAHHLPRFC